VVTFKLSVDIHNLLEAAMAITCPEHQKNLATPLDGVGGNASVGASGGSHSGGGGFGGGVEW
jgi:hypothetical protein